MKLPFIEMLDFGIHHFIIFSVSSEMIEVGLIHYKKNTLISTLTPNTQQAYIVLKIDSTLIQRHGVESILNLC